MLAAILAANAHLRGVLFDRPSVIAGDVSSELAGFRRALRAGGRDFFTSVPAGHDVYVLSHVLHDWDDEDAARILTNCRAAMNDGGRVVIVEGVLGRGGPPHPVKIRDVGMLVLTGRRRADRARVSRPARRRRPAPHRHHPDAHHVEHPAGSLTRPRKDDPRSRACMSLVRTTPVVNARRRYAPVLPRDRQAG